jgi:hypothetical protein
MPRPATPVTITCTAWLVLCLAAFSNAGIDTPILIGVCLVAVAWMLVWLIRCLREFRRRRQQPDGLTRSRRHCLIEPLVLVACLAGSHLGWFAQLRFSLSESALMTYAAEVRRGAIRRDDEFHHSPRRVGLYTVTMTDLLPDGTVRLITSSHNLLDRAGFAHSPSQPPPKRGEDTYTHLRGHWWVWRESW